MSSSKKKNMKTKYKTIIVIVLVGYHLARAIFWLLKNKHKEREVRQ